MHIKSKIIKAVLLAAGKTDVRRFARGVHINARHIVATDGHRMHAYAHGQEWLHDGVTIPREAVELALKGKALDLEVTPLSIGAVSYTPTGGKYPDYMRVIPAVSVPPTIGPLVTRLQAAYLTDAQKFIKAVGIPLGHGDCLTCFGDTWTWQKENAVVVVMGMKPTKKCPHLSSLERFQ